MNKFYAKGYDAPRLVFVSATYGGFGRPNDVILYYDGVNSLTFPASAAVSLGKELVSWGEGAIAGEDYFEKGCSSHKGMK